MKKKKSTRPTSNVQRKRVTLVLNAPDANAVYLMGDFNHWNQMIHPMKQEEDGTWKKTIMVKPGRYEYRFLVDDQWWNDASNDHLCRNCFGTDNNVLEVIK